MPTPHDRTITSQPSDGFFEWPDAADQPPIVAACPCCGDAAGKPAILRMPWPNASDGGKSALLRCTACGCGFFHPAEVADYRAGPPGGMGPLAFYLQQGAGLWGITANLDGIGRPPGTRFLEVGCGFGFGLDFARRALGWDVLGLDPSPFAVAGRESLGLPIESRYLVIDDAAGDDRFDVVMASEVIEHVPSPPAFARTLRGALVEGGTLVLTTPDVDAVAADTPSGLLLPLLSPGYHLVLQSQRSLAALLRAAGFAAVEVRRVGGASLTARCRRGQPTDRPLADGVAAPGAPNRDRYRRYLEDAATAAQPDHDLWFGLTARAYREAVNDADRPAADVLWDRFSAACQRRFGFDPEAPPMPAGDAAAGRDAGEPLEDLAAREPLCLGPVLLHRALHRLLTGDPRTAVEPLFGRAAEACGRLRRSLQRTGTDDGDTEDVAWVARAEELVCAAERGAPDVPERFDALGPAPGDTVARRDGLPLRTEWYRRRLFVSLVNAKRLEDADCFTAVVAAVERRAALPGTVLADDELDVLFCGAMRELQRARGKGAAERTFELLSPRNKSAAERAFEMLPPRGKRAAERALELLRPSEEAAAASGQPAAQRALELLRRLRVACDAARAAGCTGSAERLVEPARNAELLAIEILGQRQERGMALAEPAGNAGRQTPNR